MTPECHGAKIRHGAEDFVGVNYIEEEWCTVQHLP